MLEKLNHYFYCRKSWVFAKEHIDHEDVVASRFYFYSLIQYRGVGLALYQGCISKAWIPPAVISSVFHHVSSSLLFLFCILGTRTKQDLIYTNSIVKSEFVTWVLLHFIPQLSFSRGQKKTDVAKKKKKSYVGLQWQWSLPPMAMELGRKTLNEVYTDRSRG